MINDKIKPTTPVEFVADLLPAGSKVLDLGSGTGRDSLYLASLGHHVMAVDSSRQALEKLEQSGKELKLQNFITSIEAKVEDYVIFASSYGLINCAHILHFLTLDQAVAVIRKMIDGVEASGYLTITTFSKNEADYLAKEFLYNRGYFSKEELLVLLKDLNILMVNEQVIEDIGHPGRPEPHEHHVIEVVARKGGNR